jgi:hypothetical protein
MKTPILVLIKERGGGEGGSDNLLSIRETRSVAKARRMAFMVAIEVRLSLYYRDWRSLELTHKASS